MNREKDMANYAAVLFVSVSLFFLLFPTSRIAHSARILMSYSLYPSLHYGSDYEHFIRNVPRNILDILRTDQENRVLRARIKELEVSAGTAVSLREENDRLASEMKLAGSLPFLTIFPQLSERLK